MLIDKVKIYVKAGDGGHGAISFHREKYVPSGGPDGGDGGRGGSVIFRVDSGMNTLLAFKYKHKFIAQSGDKGGGDKFYGKSGEDLIINVPVGTLLRDAESGRIIHDMSQGGDYIACRGGRGGWGNRHFATPTRQAPRFAKNGTPGEELNLILELKMIADVGLIGFPNVGKSSILSRISAAKPKIADYHFTTLSPNLGVVSLGGEGHGFVAADIPGLIEGASEGLGLGHEFLRHVDRCRLLLHVVDISAAEERSPIEDVQKIDHELKKYSEQLSGAPQIMVANKTDMLDRSQPYVTEFEEYISSLGRDLYYVSAVSGEGLDELVSEVGKKLATLPPITVYEQEIVPQDEIFARGEGVTDTIVRREGDKFFVEGQWLFNLMGQVNFDDYESLNFFQRVLSKRGVFDLLRQNGAKDGDTINIFDFEFDFIP